MRTCRDEHNDNDTQALAEFDAAPGIPAEHRSDKKRGPGADGGRRQRPRLPRLGATAVSAPASPASSGPRTPRSPLSLFEPTSSEEEDDGKPSAAPARGFGRGAAGRGRAGRGGAAGLGPGDGGAPGAEHVGPGGGRGGHGPLAEPAAPRWSQMQWWGKPRWSLSGSVRGYVADCRCHTDFADTPGVSSHCRKFLTLNARKSPTTMEEARRLAKIWLLTGHDIPDTSDIGRSDHVATDPREHFIGWTEAQIDNFATDTLAG